MEWFTCHRCQRRAPLTTMDAWLQEGCAGAVHHLCPPCRPSAPTPPAGAVRREFYVDAHRLVRTRALQPHHHHPAAGRARS